MSNAVFRIYLPFLVALILFSLSPVAIVGGILIAAIFVVAIGMLLKVFGADISGNNLDIWLHGIS